MAKIKRRRNIPKSTTEIYRVIGDKVRIARIAKGITGEQMGEWLGISEQQALKLERAEARIRIDQLVRIADATKMSLEHFLQGLEDFNEVSMTNVQAQEVTRSTGELISLWQRIPTSERTALLSVIRSAAGE